jgi:hypothetical protein
VDAVYPRSTEISKHNVARSNTNSFVQVTLVSSNRCSRSSRNTIRAALYLADCATTLSCSSGSMASTPFRPEDQKASRIPTRPFVRLDVLFVSIEPKILYGHKASPRSQLCPQTRPKKYDEMQDKASPDQEKGRPHQPSWRVGFAYTKRGSETRSTEVQNSPTEPPHPLIYARC